MKVSYNWLNTFFDKKLPSADAVVEALTFHVFEVDGVERIDDDVVLDVKVTANRGHDCLSHRGIARELSAILKLPIDPQRDPFAKKPDLSKRTGKVKVSIEDQESCRRFTAAYLTGVKVGPSPEWLKQSLEAIGQRSINNVVDATNFVMFDTGQPLHAYDAGKLSRGRSSGNTEDRPLYAIEVRAARAGERMIALDDKEYALKPSDLVVADANADTAVGIAGVKGGKPSGVDDQTTDIILESANFDGASVRRTAASLKLRTDASDRFQQVISSELAAYGLQQAVELIRSLADGEVEGFADEYPSPFATVAITVPMQKVNAVLGTKLADADISDVFTRLGFSFKYGGGAFIVEAPSERLDLTIPEDLIEEVGRIVGYDAVLATPLLPLDSARGKPKVNADFLAAEQLREELMARGYSEMFTSVFAEKGERVVANKVDGVRPFLRRSLLPGLQEALERNVRTKAILGLREVKLFEIGAVWRDGRELVVVGTVGEKEEPAERVIDPGAGDAYPSLPVSNTRQYRSFSKFPFIVRDIAMWIPEDPNAFSEAVSVFAEHNHGLLQHVDLFDQYHKDGRASYAFHLVLQSFEKTLTDGEVNAIMEEIYAAVKAKGWEVR